MEIIILSFLLLSLFLLSLLLFLKPKTKQTLNIFPPGPKPLPLIGNLLLLGGTTQPHVIFTSLSKTYGPIFSLKLGQVKTTIISSTEIAKELFLDHDLALAARHVPAALHARNHHQHSMAWLTPGPLWRSLRKICATELFTTRRLDGYGSLRRQKVQELLDYISESSKKGVSVEIGRVVFTTTFNLLSRTIFSIDLASLSSHSSQELKNLVESAMVVAGTPNISDFFPILAKLDLQGKLRKMTDIAEKLQTIFDEQIYGRIRAREEGSMAKNDFLDVLLDSQFEVKESDFHELIRSLFSDIFAAGTDTTSSTVEWAMAELLRDPISMKKARDELMSVIGQAVELEESDINRLPFLQAIVKETFRLHPPVPFLLPRRAQQTTDLCGYTIPQDSQLLINVWAIGRDEKTWKNAHEFSPDRFLDKEVDFKGRDFELIPFGAGRRICPGLPLAYRMVHLILGSLLHRFEWKLPEETMSKGIDMSENFGVTLCMASHLKAIAIPIPIQNFNCF